MAASAYFCGSRTHTSMSASLTSRSTSRWCDTSVESWSGRSRSTTPCSCVVLAAAGEHRVAGHLVAGRDAEPLEELLGALAAPDAGGGPRGGRAADADGGELELGQRVERRRLARAGGAGQRDDGVLRRQLEAAGGPVDDSPGRRRGSRRRRDPARRPRPARGLARVHRCQNSGRPASWPPRARTTCSPSTAAGWIGVPPYASGAASSASAPSGVDCGCPALLAAKRRSSTRARGRSQLLGGLGRDLEAVEQRRRSGAARCRAGRSP